MVIGVDIGGTHTKMGLITSKGKIVARKTFSTKSFPHSEDYLQHLAQNIKKLTKHLNNVNEICGIGIGAPGINAKEGTIEKAANLGWKDLPLRQFLQNAFPITVEVINDADAAALGEKRFGAAKGMNDFMVVTLGTGLGSGVFMNGALVNGSNGRSGEIGHIEACANGRTCGCGKSGCLETYVSATGIKRTVFELISDLRYDSLLRGISFNELTADRIAHAYSKGDKIAQMAFEFTGELLGRKLADIVILLNIEGIILTGGLTKSGNHLFCPLKKSFIKHKRSYNKAKVLPSDLPVDDIGILGAGALILDRLKNESTGLC